MVRRLRLICERGHVYLGVVYDDQITNRFAAKESLREQIATYGGRAFCPYWSSAQLRYADSVTEWRSMREALPHLRAEQREATPRVLALIFAGFLKGV